MNIVFLKTDALKEYENNPRVITDRAVDAVAESIAEFGFKTPILIDNENTIIAGHTRLKAAKKLGINEVPCIYCDDLSEEEANAFRLIDNKSGEFADWDLEKLCEELAELTASGYKYDFDGLGLSDMPEVDLTDMFLDKETHKHADDEEGEVTRVQCPHCGEWCEI